YDLPTTQPCPSRATPTSESPSPSTPESRACWPAPSPNLSTPFRSPRSPAGSAADPDPHPTSTRHRRAGRRRLGSMTEFIVHVENRPGRLATITELLSDAGVNIEALAAYGYDGACGIRLIGDYDATLSRSS